MAAKKKVSTTGVGRQVLEGMLALVKAELREAATEFRDGAFIVANEKDRSTISHTTHGTRLLRQKAETDEDGVQRLLLAHQQGAAKQALSDDLNEYGVTNADSVVEKL